MQRRRGLNRPQLPNQKDTPRVPNPKTRSKKYRSNTPLNVEKLSRLPNPKILVKRRLGGIGDVLMTTPLLRAIKKHVPHCTLTYATDMAYSQGALADIIRRNPYVDELTQHGSTSDAIYDYSIDITSTGLSEEKKGSIPPNRIDMFAQAAGLSVADDPVPIYYTSEEEKELARKEMEKFSSPLDRKDAVVFVVQARSNDARRTWPLTSVQKLCDLLSKNENHRVLLFDWGNTAELFKENERLFVIKDKEFKYCASMIEASDMVICPDSSFLHLSGAFFKKTVSIFGPIPPESRINHYPNTIAVINKVACKNCVSKDSYVLTETGYKEISEIVPGENIYTSNGSLEEVVDTQTNNREERNIHELTVFGSNEPLFLTEDHKVLIAKKTYSWKKKDWIHLGKRNGIPQLSEPEWVETSKINIGDYCCIPIPAEDKSPTHPFLQNKELAWFLGLFIAEGWTSLPKNNNRSYSIYLSIAANENELIYPRIKKIIEENPSVFNSDKHNFGFIRSYPNTRGNSTIILINNKSAVMLLHSLFNIGEGKTINKAKEKHIPYQLLFSKRDLVESFLSGVYDGDGYNDKKSIVYSTASKELAYGIQILESKLGRLAKVYKRNRDTNFKKDAIIYRIYRSKEIKFKRWYKDSKYFYVPIKKNIISERKDTFVYDLSIKNDPTFTIQNISVFDCWYNPSCNRHSGNKLECLNGIKPESVYEAAMKHLKEPDRIDCEPVYGKTLSVHGQDKIILVKRLSKGLGDILMASTGIEALKKRYPNFDIHVAVPEVLFPALYNTNYISELVDINKPINLKRYHMILDISAPCARYETVRVSSGKPVEKNRVEIYAEALGVRNLITDLKPRYFLTEEESFSAREFIKTLNLKKRINVGLCLKSAEDYRSWPNEKINELVSLIKNKCNVFIFNDSQKDIFEDTVDVCGMPLRKSLAILNECSSLITVDTGLLHAAQALKIPTIALFGPIDYKARCRGYEDIIVIKADLPCIPCWRNGVTMCKRTKSIKGYSECLSIIPAQNVAETLLAKISLLL